MRWKSAASRAREEGVAHKLRRSSKFYVFLWSVRDELFDDAFQDELIASYSPRGQEPCPPAMLAMAMLLQRYADLSDAAAVDAAENDRRWQLVLGTLGTDEAPFGQGSIVRFRERAVAHDLDRKLVDRTVELAKRTKRYSWKRLKVVLDSSPLEGAGRVEDTWNLIGRAMGSVVKAVASATGVGADVVVEGADLTILDGASVKAALDIDWSDVDERHEALQRLVAEAERLEAWVLHHLEDAAQKPPLSDALALLRRVVEQDLEPDPDGGGDRIRDGVAEERVISISDPEMRHGRKSRSKTINGYKRHIIAANRLMLGTAVLPANRPEHEATSRLLDHARRHGDIAAANFDRGYLPSPAIADLWSRGVEIHSRPWRGTARGIFGKDAFQIFVDAGVVVCPAQKRAGVTRTGHVVFDEEDCGKCVLKPHCTTGRRRTLRLHEHEPMLIELRRKQASADGRAAYRERVDVEHRLARIEALQGSRARYRGARKNELQLNGTCAVANLQEVARLRRAA